MKKAVILILLAFAFLTACSTNATLAETTNEPATQTQIANPWKSYASLPEAESSCGLIFPLPETISDCYTAESFRVMNHDLLEVIYRNRDHKVIVRMQTGEDLDISGVYETFDSTETFVTDGASVTVSHTAASSLYLISTNGFSYSLYAPDHDAGAAAADFLSFLIDDTTPFR